MGSLLTSSKETVSSAPQAGCVNVYGRLVYSKGVHGLMLLCITITNLFVFRECGHDTGCTGLIFDGFFQLFERRWRGTLNSHQLFLSLSSSCTVVALLYHIT
jgi:hypothetical protein